VLNSKSEPKKFSRLCTLKAPEQDAKQIQIFFRFRTEMRKFEFFKINFRVGSAQHTRDSFFIKGGQNKFWEWLILVLSDEFLRGFSKLGLLSV
jgi:hypothetical protein